MKCLMKYEWVKLMRSRLPQGKGVMGAWMKLASRAAFRKGIATYCGYKNEVSPGMWSGGIVGIKSILGIKKKSDALLILDKLSELGYIKTDILYRLDMSPRHYYRLREQAITILSIRLWAAPGKDVDFWFEMLTLLEGLS